jgi:hypothetical protein
MASSTTLRQSALRSAPAGRGCLPRGRRLPVSTRRTVVAIFELATLRNAGDSAPLSRSGTVVG